MKVKSLSVVALLALSSPALADRTSADKCAAGLPKDAQTIYAAAAPAFATASDGRAVITGQTRALVMNGTIGQSGARAAAEAAGQCLQLLR